MRLAVAYSGRASASRAVRLASGSTPERSTNVDSVTLARRLLTLDLSRLVVRRSADQVDRLSAVAAAVGVAAPRLVPLLAEIPELRLWVLSGEVMS